MLALVVTLAWSAPSSTECGRFLERLATVAPDDVADTVRFGRAEACRDGAADDADDAALRALVPDVRARAVCLLGSAALDDLRRGVVDDSRLPLPLRGRCLAAVVAHDERELVRRAVIHGDDGRAHLTPLALSAARQSDDKRPFAPLLVRAKEERALGRWELQGIVCREQNPAVLEAPCRALQEEEEGAADDVAVSVVSVGAIATGTAAIGAGAAWLIAAFALQDTLLAIPMGALGGAFVGAAIGAVLGAFTGVQLAQEEAAPRLKPGVAGVVMVPVAMVRELLSSAIIIGLGIVVGTATGAAVVGLAGGLVAFFPGPPRTAADLAGGVGVAACIGIVGGSVTLVLASGVTPDE